MITETCVIHPRLLLGAGRAGAAGSTAEAARRPRSSPELGAWASRARPGLRDLAHRGQGARAVLTVGSWWPELRRREVVVVDRRRNRGVARGRGRGSGLRAPGRCGSTRRAPTKPVEWSERAERHQRQAIASAQQAHLRRFRRDSGATRGGWGDKNAREVLWSRGGANAGLAVVRGAAERLVRGGAEARRGQVARRRQLGLGGGASGMGWGFRGVGRYL